MPCYWVAPGVRFNDYLFTEPEPLSSWRSPGCAGIVAILGRNPQWSPKPFEPLYFGELAQAARHPDPQADQLYVSVLPLPFSTVSQRRAIAKELNAAYRVGTGPELAQRVEELEARQQEQSQQILSLLTFIAKLFEPQPVPARKPIGFLTQLAPATESES